MTEKLNSTTLSDDDVLRFLKQNPHFLEDHPNLLKKLHLKHDSGEAISLIERQNMILRKENIDLIDRLNKFISVAQRNDRLFLKLQALVLDLVSCQTLNGMTKTLTTGLTTHFDVDDVQVVFTHQTNSDGDLWLRCDKEILLDYFPSTMVDLRNQCGEYTEMARQLLFNEQPVKSMAIGVITLNNESIGLLALGSHSAAHFRSSTDTLFLGHLCQVVSKLLTRV